MIWLWSGFAVLVVGLLALDLGVFHRRPHRISVGEALGWTAFWVALALFFNALVYLLYENHWLGHGEAVGHALSGREAAMLFFTAYVMEKSLSVDNIFVIAMIFAYFKVPPELQHRVLFWGVVGALVMRAAVIVGGIALIERFAWLVYVFGALLIVTAVKMLVVRHDNLEPGRNPVIRVIRRRFRVTEDFHGRRFFVSIHGRRAATPLLLSLAIVETTDLLFAVDSIPAVLAVTLDPFLVFTSNVFAILGLRSLYFALAAMMSRFRYLKMSLVFVLAYVGVKMLLSHHYPIPAVVSLAVVGVILGIGVAASLLAGGDDPAALASPIDDELASFYRVTVRTVRRAFILVAGATLLLVGALMLVLPGPGIVVIILGLTVLATEYLWARVWLARARKTARELADDVRGIVERTRRRRRP